MSASGHYQILGRHLFGDGRAGGDETVVRYGQRRHQHAVGADEHPVAEGGLVLLDPVEVTEHGAGTDVAALTDDRIADVGQVIGLAIAADSRVLGLHEVADSHALRQHGAGPEPRHRPHRGVRADGRPLRLGAVQYTRFGGHFAVLQYGVGTDDYILAHSAVLQYGIGADIRILRHSAALQHGTGTDAHILSHRAAFQYSAGGYGHSIAKAHFAFKHRIHIDFDIAATIQFAANIQPRRIP